jgi:4-hydroxy-3-polyprenylbenzoate decarboxylase
MPIQEAMTMTDKESDKVSEPQAASRREFLARTGTSLAALSALATGCSESAPPAAQTTSTANEPAAAMLVPNPRSDPDSAPKAPFDSIRDYVAALEAHGLLLRIPRIDQDEYETTALLFRATDRYGMFGAPALLFEKIKIEGKWRDGPVLANPQGNWDADCILAGLEPIPDDRFATYRKAKAHWTQLLFDGGGSYPLISPVEVVREQAPCKEVILTGDEIDLLDFAFIKSNPADAGRYLNTGSVFTTDDKLGDNFGTYRCEITGPRKLSINSEKNHVGYKTWMAARERGEATAKVSIVVGQDPIIWLLSGAPIARRREEKVDELAMAGGMRGKALEVVRSETNSMLIPAHCEMVVEGEIPLQDPLVTEGPFGEMFGYLGPQKEAVFTMNVTKVTHRKNPWILNSYTGMHRGYITSPVEALYDQLLRKMVPSLVEFHYPQNMMGVAFASINKDSPYQGLDAGRQIAARIPIVKVMVVVDSDMNVLDPTEMWFTIGSRWQPFPASEIIPEARGIITDPSAPEDWKSSNIVIDATKQWPEEGGPEVYPKRNRTLLEEGAPKALVRVDVQFGQLLKDWGNG